jgi:sigma-B regulation protein RsbU (phosphoserine phosphatase)
VGVVTLAINGLSIWNAVQTRREVERQQQQLAPAGQQIGALRAALADQEAGLAGYELAGVPTALAPYTRGRLAAADLVAQLHQELRGDATALADLGRVEQLDRAWITTVAAPRVATAAVAPGSVAADTVETADRTAFDAIGARMTALAGEVAARNQALSDAVLHDASQTIVVALVRSWFLLAILAALWLVLNRLVSTPVERLNADVEAVAAGSLDRPIPSHGLRELTTLGRSTEAMRLALRHDSDELRQLRQALAQRSPLHGLIRSELQSTEDRLDAAIAGRLLPADGVLAGDWYDAWEIGDRRVALALVDVSGHGPEAGIMALRLKHLLGPPFRMGMSPGSALDWVADQLDDLDEQCVTAFLLDLDPVSGRCRYANAGHPSGLLFRDDRIEWLERTGPLICGIRGRSWSTREVRAGAGDLLVLVTDGLIEARLPDGAEFGLDRIRDIVTAMGRSAAPDAVAEGLVEGVREACVTPLRDDATVVVVRFDAPGEPVSGPVANGAASE